MCGFRLKLEVDGGWMGQLKLAGPLLDLTAYSPLMLCCQQCRAQLRSLIWRMRSFLERQDRFIPPAGDICAIFFPSFWGVGVFWISRDFNGKWLHHVFSVTGKCSGLLDGWSPHPEKIRPAALVLFLLIRFQFSIWEYLPWQFSRSGINFCYIH
jgi:hypothetical protein